MKSKIIIFFVFCSSVGSAPVEIPNQIKTDSAEKKTVFYENWFEGINVSLNFDRVSERELEELESKVKANFFQGKISYVFPEFMEVYFDFGRTEDLEFSFLSHDNRKTISLSESSVLGTGVNMVFGTWVPYGLKFFGDFKYRISDDMKVRKSKSNSVSSEYLFLFDEVDWEEWQFALGMSKRWGWVIPYGGVKISDVSIRGILVRRGQWEFEGLDSKKTAGVFAGLAFAPNELLSIEAEMRERDETAFSVKVSYHF